MRCGTVGAARRTVMERELLGTEEHLVHGAANIDSQTSAEGVEDVNCYAGTSESVMAQEAVIDARGQWPELKLCRALLAEW